MEVYGSHVYGDALDAIMQFLRTQGMTQALKALEQDS
jgi:hypothetical protein